MIAAVLFSHALFPDALFESSIQEADVSLCVLSLPDVIRTGGLPPPVEPLMTFNTLVLLNKQDLVVQAELRPYTVKQIQNSWNVSLATGAGMSDFMEGLGKVLKQR